MRKDTGEFLKKDPSLTNPILLLFHAGYHSMLLYRIYKFFHRLKLYPISYTLYLLSRIIYSVDIHPDAEIEPGVVLDHAVGTVIGSTATVGEGTLIYHGVTLGAKRVCSGKRHPDVGRNVVIGAGAKILGPIKIGDGAVIGANAVVLRNVPSHSMVAGVPARVIKSHVSDSSVHDGSDDSVETGFLLDRDGGGDVGRT